MTDKAKDKALEYQRTHVSTATFEEVIDIALADKDKEIKELKYDFTELMIKSNEARSEQHEEITNLKKDIKEMEFKI